MFGILKPISSEVKELGKEIVSFYEQLEVKHIYNSYHEKYHTECKFRGIQITHKHERGKISILFAGFCSLTAREKNTYTPVSVKHI